jgi:putative phosphoribosyl transferase
VTEPWADRTAAGALLGDRLATAGLVGPLVLGLARGGMEVAAPVAAALSAPLDVLVVRKVGRPGQPELGLGAVTEAGLVVWDDFGLMAAGLMRADLSGVVEAERAECGRRVSAYRDGRPAPPVHGQTVVLVDDGIATGVTARAAVRDVRAGGAARVVVAAPVVAAATVARLAAEGCEVVALLTAKRFGAVSRFYDRFDQTSDATVLSLLRSSPNPK